MKLSDVFVGKELFVGCPNKAGVYIEPVAIGIGPTRIRGSAYIEGPILTGDPTSFVVPEANLMVGRCQNIEAGGPLIPPSIFKVSSRANVPTPIDVMLGDPTGPVGIHCICGPMPFVVQSTTFDVGTVHYGLIALDRINFSAFKLDETAQFNIGVDLGLGLYEKFDAGLNFFPALTTVGYGWDTWTFGGSSILSNKAEINKKKGFDIPHPTKENHRLRYICPEGPRADVYVRGKLKDKNVIELPDYWRGLVDPETIDVSLTPFGSYQELYVESIQWGQRIVVKNSSGGPINCSYIVYGERNDGEKNIPEYQGLTSDDYPGDNSEYNINT
jgi:hypothetical protein